MKGKRKRRKPKYKKGKKKKLRSCNYFHEALAEMKAETKKPTVSQSEVKEEQAITSRKTDGAWALIFLALLLLISLVSFWYWVDLDQSDTTTPVAVKCLLLVCLSVGMSGMAAYVVIITKQLFRIWHLLKTSIEEVPILQTE